MKVCVVSRWLNCCHTGQEALRTSTAEETWLCTGAWDIGMATGTCLDAHASINVAVDKVCAHNSALPCSHGQMLLEPAAVEELMTAVKVVLHCKTSMVFVSSSPA